ncbi:MAG: glutathione S-transferase N-terminal domain-containing protein [Pseudomonadales bacterium]|nr:glutathione S-transferase N-terminal domain-containing protein [Pseudomonadales bacterium]
MNRLVIPLLVLLTFIVPTVSSASILDSGKSAKEIAEEILHGAKERYRKQQQEKAKAKKIVMYSTTWCGYCRKARNYFNAKRIPFVEHNIEKNRNAKREYDRLGGRGVPLIVIGERLMRGFSQKKFEQIYRSI